MRAMGELKKEFRKKGVEFVAVNVQDSEERARAFIAESGLDYTWVRADDAEASDAGISNVPALIVVDADGNVAWRSSLLTLVRGPEVLRPVLSELISGEPARL